MWPVVYQICGCEGTSVRTAEGKTVGYFDKVLFIATLAEDWREEEEGEGGGGGGGGGDTRERRYFFSFGRGVHLGRVRWDEMDGVYCFIRKIVYRVVIICFFCFFLFFFFCFLYRTGPFHPTFIFLSYFYFIFFQLVFYHHHKKFGRMGKTLNYCAFLFLC